MRRKVYAEEELVPIDKERLKEARESAKLSLDEIQKRLARRKIKISRSALGHYERGHVTQMRQNVFEGLCARGRGILGPDINPRWLQGDKDEFPIVFSGHYMPPELLRAWKLPEQEMRLMTLRGVRFAAQCMDAARRDYELIEQQKAAGEEWSRIEFHLFARFYLLPQMAQFALNLTYVEPASATTRWKTAEELRRQSPEEARAQIAQTKAENLQAARMRRVQFEENQKVAIDYWSRVLHPWFQGSTGFNYEAFAALPRGSEREDRRSSPRAILDILEPPPSPKRSRSQKHRP